MVPNFSVLFDAIYLYTLTWREFFRHPVFVLHLQGIWNKIASNYYCVSLSYYIEYFIINFPRTYFLTYSSKLKNHLKWAQRSNSKSHISLQKMWAQSDIWKSVLRLKPQFLNASKNVSLSLSLSARFYYYKVNFKKLGLWRCARKK